MENVNEINEKIAKNLVYYRKQAGYTQAELAEKINYTDKSISKWVSASDTSEPACADKRGSRELSVGLIG